MTPRGDGDLAAIDDGLTALFAAGPPVPPAFTAAVLRRIQEERWRREAFLDRVFYAGLCASGVLVLIGLWVGLDALATVLPPGLTGRSLASASLVRVPGDVAMRLGLAGAVLTAVATWRRLGSLLR